MQYEKNDGIDFDDVTRNEFIAYITKAFYRCMIRYDIEQQQRSVEINMDPDELELLALENPMTHEQSAAEAAGFSPRTWAEVMDTIENPKLDRILSQLTPDEQELMFYRLFHKLSYKEIAQKKSLRAQEVERSYATILRKLRRWGGEP